MSVAEVVVRTREEAGRLAREEAAMLDRMVERMRLASFRSYLLATVETASALVPDVLRMAGSDVPTALQRLRPGHMWPMITKLEAQYGRTGPATNRRVRVAGRLVTRPAPLVGDAVITQDALGDWVEAKVFGGSLDVSLRSDGFELSTMDGTGYIRLPGTLPDTVMAACVGRPLTDVVEHSLFSGRGFVIGNAANVGGASSLAFDVGRLPVELPWRD